MSWISVILVGPMGSGKTTIGRALAERLGLDHVDTDGVVEAESGRSVSEIFASEGESGFRDREHEVLSQVLAGRAAVISTGGGVVTREDNRALLKRSDALVVWLDPPIKELVQRLEDGATRPLLRAGDIEQSLFTKIVERNMDYAEVSDLHLDTAGLSVRDVVALIATSPALPI